MGSSWVLAVVGVFLLGLPRLLVGSMVVVLGINGVMDATGRCVKVVALTNGAIDLIASMSPMSP